MINKIPRPTVAIIRFRYFFICLSLKDLMAACMVRLLSSMTVVENQNARGTSKVVQPGWSRFTIYALVSPANIMMMLPIATQRVNL